MDALLEIISKNIPFQRLGEHYVIKDVDLKAGTWSLEVMEYIPVTGSREQLTPAPAPADVLKPKRGRPKKEKPLEQKSIEQDSELDGVDEQGLLKF